MIVQRSESMLPEGQRQSGVHFVTHSVGALILRGALRYISSHGMDSRVVMIAPTNTGCYTARALSQSNINFAMKAAVQTVLGDKAGRELMELSAEDVARTIPQLPVKFAAMVIAGTQNTSWGTPFLPRNERECRDSHLFFKFGSR